MYGTVRYYDRKEKHGWIKSDGGREITFVKDALPKGWEYLEPGDIVEFKVDRGLFQSLAAKEIKVRGINALRFAEIFSQQDWLNEYIDEWYWTDDFSTDTCYKAMLAEADAEGLQLLGLEDFDYDSFFYNCYRHGLRSSAK